MTETLNRLNEHSITTQGTVDGFQEATIDPSGYTVLMDMLSKNYTLKKDAVIREIGTNAIDSHREAGNTDPIIINLPTIERNSLIIQDFGVGMDLEKARESFNTYVLSTKTENPGAIGKYGIGAKSIYTVTNQFTVEATYNGVKHLIVFTRNDDGVPGNRVIHQTPTDAPNGVKITIPTYHEEYKEWIYAARRVLHFFEPESFVLHNMPEEHDLGNYRERIIDAMSDDHIITLENTGNSYSSLPPRVKLGPIVYDIPRTMRQELNISEYNGYHNTLFVFHPDEIKIHHSRESIEDTKPNIEAIQRSITRWKNNIEQLIAKQLFNAATLMEYGKTLDQLQMYRHRLPALQDFINFPERFMNPTLRQKLQDTPRVTLYLAKREEYSSHYGPGFHDVDLNIRSRYDSGFGISRGRYHERADNFVTSKHHIDAQYVVWVTPEISDSVDYIPTGVDDNGAPTYEKVHRRTINGSNYNTLNRWRKQHNYPNVAVLFDDLNYDAYFQVPQDRIITIEQMKDQLPKPVKQTAKQQAAAHRSMKLDVWQMHRYSLQVSADPHTVEELLNIIERRELDGSYPWIVVDSSGNLRELERFSDRLLSLAIGKDHHPNGDPATPLASSRQIIRINQRSRSKERVEELLGRTTVTAQELISQLTKSIKKHLTRAEKQGIAEIEAIGKEHGFHAIHRMEYSFRHLDTPGLKSITPLNQMRRVFHLYEKGIISYIIKELTLPEASFTTDYPNLWELLQSAPRVPANVMKIVYEHDKAQRS